MSDREEIIQLINLYGFAMDTQRWDLFDRIFTEDCDADYGPTSHWTDRARFKDALKEGEGTVFAILEIQFDAAIPDAVFSKAALKK